MSKNSKVILIITTTIVVLGLVVFIVSSGEDPMQSTSSSNRTEPSQVDETASSNSNSASEQSALTPGAYEDYSPDKLANTSGDKVLFFHAKWCPTCRALDQNIRAGVVPDGVTIFKLDYDTETELAKKHGVTFQHTLVQVDDNGNQIKKWAGSYTIEQISDELI